jgi:hypothetical protein
MCMFSSKRLERAHIFIAKIICLRVFIHTIFTSSTTKMLLKVMLSEW